MEIALRAIAGDEIDLGLDLLGDIGEFGSVFECVVGVFDEDVFQGDHAVGGGAVVLASGQDIGQWMAVAGGDQSGAQLVSRGMEGDRQVPRAMLVSQPPDALGDAAGGDCHLPGAQAKAVRRADRLQGDIEMLKIVQRFAHAHDHDVADPAAVFAAGDDHLVNDFRWTQVADKALPASGAEDAANRATDLGADAGGRPAWGADQDAFNGIAVVEAEQPFDCVVVIALGFDWHSGAEVEVAGQFLPEFFWKVGHLFRGDG